MSRQKIYGPSQQLIDLGPDHKNLVPIAEDIAIKRGRLVAEAMLHMAAIRSLQADATTGTGAPVQCVAAHLQTSSAQHGQQAAHLLPGQILVAGKPVWMLATTRDSDLSATVQRLCQQTQMCFAWTNVLPALFNRADSEAEGTGQLAATQTLKPLFGDVVRDLWHNARVDSARPLTIDRAAVLETLLAWFRQISQVYRDAAGRKAARGRLDEARVLETYGESFRVANAGRFVLSQLPQVYQQYRYLS